MASCKLKIFRQERGAPGPAGMDDFLSKIRRDGVHAIVPLELASGSILYALTYSETPMLLVESAPAAGATSVPTGSAVHLAFDEDVASGKAAVLGGLEAYRNGTLVALTEANLSIAGGRIRIAGGTGGLIDGTATATYHLIVKAGLPAASGRALGGDRLITFKTA